MGNLAYYAAWEHIYHLCGGARWLAQFAISHWAFGPSAILERVTERARDEVLPGLMAGEQMMCFGMSEPDAGSDATMMRTRAEPDGRRLAPVRPQDLDHPRAHRRLDDRAGHHRPGAGRRPGGAGSAPS